MPVCALLAQNDNLGGHRDKVQKQAFFADAFTRYSQGRSVYPSDDAGRNLIDQVVTFLSEAPKAFPLYSGGFVAALVKGNVSRTIA